LLSQKPLRGKEKIHKRGPPDVAKTKKRGGRDQIKQLCSSFEHATPRGTVIQKRGRNEASGRRRRSIRDRIHGGGGVTDGIKKHAAHAGRIWKKGKKSAVEKKESCGNVKSERIKTGGNLSSKERGAN